MKVIAGFLGGRKIQTVGSNQTRPTSAKIRGAIFNTLGQYFNEETEVLDLFAGSGALAIEAISRGSKRALVVENKKEACRVIKNNCKNLDIADKIILYCGDYRTYLTTSHNDAFDLIFLDPPYQMKVISDILHTLFARKFVRRGGRIVIEISNVIYQAADLQFLEKYDVIFNRAYDTTQIIIIENNKGGSYE